MTASIENLSDDLVAEILHRLSYKESRRCLCVCKTWSLLVSQPSFLKKLIAFHGSRPPKVQQAFAIVNIIGHQDRNIHVVGRCRFLGHDEDNSEPPVVVFDRSLDFLPKKEGEEMEVLRVSGDLFLCGHTKEESSILRPKWAHSGSDGDHYYYVCNPITRQWVVLPPRARGHLANIQFYSSQFYEEEDPTARNKSICRPEYEYVVLTMLDDELQMIHQLSSSMNVEFFSSKAGVWRTLSLSIPQGFYIAHEFWLQESCLHEGVLWYCNANQLVRYNIKDLSQEPLLINLPRDYVFSAEMTCYIGVCCGRFHLVGLYELYDEENPTASSCYLMVWELDEEEQGGKWRLLHKMCLPVDMDILYVGLHPGHPDIVFFELCHRLVECNVRTQDFKFRKKAATKYTACNRSKGQIFFIPPPYPTPVLPLNSNMQEENWSVVTSIWEQVDLFREFRKDTQVV